MEVCGTIVIMRLLDNPIANDIVRSTILKLGGLGHATRKNLNYSEIEFCGNFDHINLLTNRLSNT